LTKLLGMFNRFKKINGNLPRPRVIFVDVDDTLLINNRVNSALVRWIILKAAEGYDINVWSMRGEQAAEDAVEQCKLTGVVNACLSKPGIIVDDKGWTWTKNTKSIRPI